MTKKNNNSTSLLFDEHVTCTK